MSTALHPNIQMFQYPLHTNSIAVSDWAYERRKKITTRVKEQVGRVEVEIPIDGGPDVWRYERASELGYTMDVDVDGENGDDVVGGYDGSSRKGKKDKEKKKEKEKEKQKWGDKMRLRSEVVPSATGYYSGQIFDGASEPPAGAGWSARGVRALINRSIALAPHLKVHSAQDVTAISRRKVQVGRPERRRGEICTGRQCVHSP
jgi:hypothetical protein